MLITLAIWVLCLASAWGLWLVINDERNAQDMERKQAKAELQAELTDATKRLVYKTGLEVTGRRWTRELDRKRYRRHYLDMKHEHYIAKWRQLWDGMVS